MLAKINTPIVLGLTCFMFSTWAKLAGAHKEVELLDAQARSARKIPVPLVIYGPEPVNCTARYGKFLMDGYCDGYAACLVKGGSIIGKCASSVATCCLLARRCNGYINSPGGGYFLSPDYPSPTTTAPGDMCTLHIQRYSKQYCQVRLDFREFDLAPPNENGTCDTESLVITGNDPFSQIPVICGRNPEQHMYINFDKRAQITLKVTTSSEYANTIWDIKVTQIECGSAEQAPNGCLQYYTEDIRTDIRSFNFEGGIHLAEQDYEICISNKEDLCEYTWTAETFEISAYTFGCKTVVGDFCLNLPHISLISGIHTPCETCFNCPYAPPEPEQNAYCGDRFPAEVVATYNRMHVVLPAQDLNDVLPGSLPNRGFLMSYLRIC